MFSLAIRESLNCGAVIKRTLVKQKKDTKVKSQLALGMFEFDGEGE